MGNILLLEDDKSLNRGISFKLKKEGYNVCTAFNIKEAKDVFENNKVDLIISDVGLPDGSGFDFCEEIRKISNVHIIMLTALDQEIDIVAGYDIGADDYITKPFGIMELISRVKALLRRTGSSDEEKLIGIGSLFIDDEKRVAYVDDKPVELTYKEYELLKYLALNRGIVLTRDNIMDRIWSTDYEGESRTLDVHIKTLRHKLGTAGNYIKTVRNVGYFMDDEAR